MKGKKFDYEFLSEYMDECIEQGYTTANDMCELAKNEVIEIDHAIREVEEKKKRRSKLLNVIEEFDKKKTSKKGAKILAYLDIGDPVLNKIICQSIEKAPQCETELINLVSQVVCGKNDYAKIAIKKLLKSDVLANCGIGPNGITYFSKGSKFDEYYSFLQGNL